MQFRFFIYRKQRSLLYKKYLNGAFREKKLKKGNTENTPGMGENERRDNAAGNSVSDCRTGNSDF